MLDPSWTPAQGYSHAQGLLDKMGIPAATVQANTWCPVCGASPGKPCTRIDNKVNVRRDQLHQARIQRAGRNERENQRKKARQLCQQLPS